MASAATAVRSWAIALAAMMLSACATIFGPPDDPPPEALTAPFVRTISPNMREQMWPPLFDGREYVARLICDSGEWPTALPDSKKGLVETYSLLCPGEKLRMFTFDVGFAPPPPPMGFRLLAPEPLARYQQAFAAAQKKDYADAITDLDQAIALAPKETIYPRDRVFLLYEMGRKSEALLAADAMLKQHPSALLYKYRALAARDLGLRSEVLTSLDGMMRCTHEGHPLYAEAVCAKGMILVSEGDPEGRRLIQRGCSLQYQACCDALKQQPERPAPQESPKRLIQATRSIQPSADHD